jgi:hypothetical protein
MVAAPIRRGQQGALRALLAGMTLRPGLADPDNALLPLGRFPRLHVARFVILEDSTPGDLAAHGVAFPNAPVYLAFLGDCDGDPDAQLAEFAALAAPGLRQIFGHCAGFGEATDLLFFLRSHGVAPAAQYVNWQGRTVRQVREDAALRSLLHDRLNELQSPSQNLPPVALRDRLCEAVAQAQRNGRLVLTDPDPTPPDWRLRNLLHAIAVPLALLALSPLLLLAAPAFLWQLRRQEKVDPVIAPRPSPGHVRALSRTEDHDVTNQFSAFGNVKPGRFRLWTLRFLLWVLDWAARHVYTRGRLSRVGSIHFARWVFLDDRRRLFFASNYDGSLESYMDDFINKVAWGLNLVFSNGIGYPRTRFLILGGAKDEQGFKHYIRRHQLPSEVWYKAYPGLTACDLARNAALREGLRPTTMTETKARQWLALI